MSKKDFPSKYLEGLAENHQKKVLERFKDPADRLLMYSGALLNWVGEFINDESINWKLEKIPLKDIILTGTGPEWNEITYVKAERSPIKLRKLMKKKSIREMFKEAKYVDIPILIREVDGELKVLDGMKRVIAASRDGIDEIRAYVGREKGKSKPIVEPHVIYDFIRAFQLKRGSERDFQASIRFLVNAYSNTRKLLDERFSYEWIGDKHTVKLIKEAIDSS